MTSREYLNFILSTEKLTDETRKRVEMHLAGELEDLPCTDISLDQMMFNVSGPPAHVKIERGSWVESMPEYRLAALSIGPVGFEFTIVGVSANDLRRLGAFLQANAEKLERPV
jgi:hypothetical protein